MTLAINRRLLRQQPRRQRPFAALMRRKFTSHLADVVVLVIALTATSTVHFVGDLPISEVILLALLPVILAARGRRVLQPEFKALFFLLGLWLLGQAVSDIYRHTAELDWIRGDATIIFFGFDLLGLAVLLRKNDRRKVIFLAGAAIGSILVTMLHPSAFAQDQPWKFGYGLGVITLVLLVSSHFYARRRYLIAGLLIVGVAGVNLLENFRGPIGQLLIVIALVFPVIPAQLGRLRILPRSGAARVAILLMLSLSAAWVAGRLVDLVTSAGLISEEARQKNEAQANAGSLLLGGRPEIQVSLQAVKDSPILGFGSWAQDPKYIEMLYDIEVEQGVIDESDLSEFETNFIPTHSHLMGAWVWAGILGAAFWFYILWLTARATIRVAILRPPLAPVYAYLVLGMFWQILFSPFGLNARMYDAVAIVVMIDLLEADPVRVRNVLVGVRRRVMFSRPRRLPNPRIFPTPRSRWS
jgi:hypothetical protein